MRLWLLTSTRLCLAGACLVLFALPVGAELYRADLGAPGDGRIVRDTESRLDWLRLTETAGHDMASILSGHGGWVDSGWRYATRSETCEMLSHVFETGVTPNCTYSGDQIGSFFALFGLLDVAQSPSDLTHASWAYYSDDDPSDPYQGELSVIRHWQFSTLVLQGAGLRENAIPQSSPFLGPAVGSLLVRATPAPVPALGLAAQLGLVGSLVLTVAVPTSRASRVASTMLRPVDHDRS